MPGFDGTGPRGEGLMTGRGDGFCVLQKSEDDPSQIEGYAGLQSAPVRIKENASNNTQPEEVRNMPRGDGTGPSGMGPMTGRAAGYCAGYPEPGYMNPGPAAGYRTPYPLSSPAIAPRFGRGRGFGRGFGREGGFGRGRGGRGRRW